MLNIFVMLQTKGEVEADNGNMKLPDLTWYQTYKLNESQYISFAGQMQECVLQLLRLQTMKGVLADHRKNETSMQYGGRHTI